MLARGVRLIAAGNSYLCGTATGINITIDGYVWLRGVCGSSGSPFYFAGGVDITIGAEAVVTLTASDSNGYAGIMLGQGTGGPAIGGADGDDWPRGGAGNDLLSGGTNDDVLTGGLGFDRLSGGTGNDRFVFYRHSDNSTVATNTVPNDAFIFIGTAAFSQVAGQLRYGSAAGVITVKWMWMATAPSLWPFG